MNRTQITIGRVYPLPVAKLAGALYGIFGVFMGIAFALISQFGGLNATGGRDPDSVLFKLIFGAGAIVILPALYGLSGFLFGLLGTFVFNWLAGRLGGICADVDISTHFCQHRH